MKAFHFTLESVLVLRQRQEKVAMGNYAQSLAAHRQSVERLEEVGQEINAASDELRGRMNGSFTASQMVHAQGYFDSLQKKRQKCVSDLNVVILRKNLAMQTMLNARQQREVVDKLFAQEKKRYDYNCSREEQKIIDDLPQRLAAFSLSYNPGKIPA